MKAEFYARLSSQMAPKAWDDGVPLRALVTLPPRFTFELCRQPGSEWDAPIFTFDAEMIDLFAENASPNPVVKVTIERAEECTGAKV